MSAWKVWPAMIVAPLVALGSQSALFALVTPSCSVQTRVGLHVVAAISLLLSVALTLLAHGEWKRRGNADWHGAESDGPQNSGMFTAATGTAVGTLSCLVIVAMWLAAVMLSPCRA